MKRVSKGTQTEPECPTPRFAQHVDTHEGLLSTITRSQQQASIGLELSERLSVQACALATPKFACVEPQHKKKSVSEKLSQLKRELVLVQQKTVVYHWMNFLNKLLG